MANNKFKAAVKKAKGLYRSGRYKTFADAVKAAYKKVSHKKKRRKVGKPTSNPSHYKRKAPANSARIGLRKKKRPHFSISLLKQTTIDHVGHQLAAAMLAHYKAKTIKATKQAAKRIKVLKQKLKSLQK